MIASGYRESQYMTKGMHEVVCTIWTDKMRPMQTVDDDIMGLKVE